MIFPRSRSLNSVFARTLELRCACRVVPFSLSKPSFAPPKKVQKRLSADAGTKPAEKKLGKCNVRLSGASRRSHGEMEKYFTFSNPDTPSGDLLFKPPCSVCSLTCGSQISPLTALYTNTALSPSRDADASISRSPRGWADSDGSCEGCSPPSVASSVSARPAGAFCRRRAKRPANSPLRAVPATAWSCFGRSYAGGAVSGFAEATVAVHASAPASAPVGWWAVSTLLTMATAVLEGTR